MPSPEALRDSARLVFDGHVLDVARRELWRGTQPITIEPQVFDLLLYLVQNADRIISRDELLRAVWQGRIVSDSAINNRLTAVRRAIGDSGDAQRLIRTVSRRGICFVGRVEEAPAGTLANSARSYSRLPIRGLGGCVLLGAAIAIILAYPRISLNRPPTVRFETGVLPIGPVPTLRNADAPGLPAIAAAPRPAPRPRYIAAPEREVVAPVLPPPKLQPVVAPVPSLPSATQLWAKVRQVAAVEGIAVPLAGTPPFDVTGTPAQYRTLLGAWGPGTWQGSPAGNRSIIVIQSIDSDSNVRGVIGSNSVAIGWRNFAAPIVEGRFTIHYHLTYNASFGAALRDLGDDYWEIVVASDDTLRGSRNNNASTIKLTRLQ